METGGFSISKLLRFGHVGFNNLSDQELIEEFISIEG